MVILVIFIALNVNMKQKLAVKNGTKSKRMWNIKRKIKHSKPKCFDDLGGRYDRERSNKNN